MKIEKLLHDHIAEHQLIIQIKATNLKLEQQMQMQR